MCHTLHRETFIENLMDGKEKEVCQPTFFYIDKRNHKRFTFDVIFWLDGRAPEEKP